MTASRDDEWTALLPYRGRRATVSGDARTAHLNGQIPAALAKVSADLLASAPDIRLVDVVAVK